MSKNNNPTGKGGFKERPDDINKSGRGVGVRTIGAILKRIGEEDCLSKDGKVLPYNKLEYVLMKVYELALKGEEWPLHFIADRTEGRPRQSISIEGNTPMVILKNADNKADEKTEPSLG